MSGNGSSIDMDRDLVPCSPSELVIRESFKKDYKLSCPLVQDQDAFYKSLVVWELIDEWKEYLEMSKNYPDFDDYRKTVRTDIIKTIEAVDGYDQLNEDAVKNPYGEYKGPRTYLAVENCGKRLVSIDLVQGNYQSLKWLGKQYVLNSETYEDLVSRFTDEPSLINSKYYRQMIFGHLKPEIHASVQRMMLAHIISELMKIKKWELVHLTNDEVAFEITSDAEMIRIREALRPLPYKFRIVEFSIYRIPNGHHEPWFIRYDKDGGQRLMSIHVRFLFQVYNWLNDIKNGKKDLWWNERGRNYTMLEPEKFAKIGSPDPHLN